MPPRTGEAKGIPVIALNALTATAKLVYCYKFNQDLLKFQDVISLAPDSYFGSQEPESTGDDPYGCVFPDDEEGDDQPEDKTIQINLVNEDDFP